MEREIVVCDDCFLGFVRIRREQGGEVLQKFFGELLRFEGLAPFILVVRGAEHFSCVIEDKGKACS